MTKTHGWQEGGLMRLQGAGGRAYAAVWRKGACQVLTAQEDRGDGKVRWHLSISVRDRYPTWDEIKDARYALLPLGATFGMLLPQPNAYVNIHPNCFHLWELPELPA